MQKFGRKINLYRSLRTNISMIVCVGVCNVEPVDLRTGCAFAAAFGSALVWNTLLFRSGFKGFGINKGAAFYVFETNLLHLGTDCVLFLARLPHHCFQVAEKWKKLCRCSSRY